MITSFGKTMCNFSFRTRATRKEFLSFIVMCLLITSIFFCLIATFSVVILGLRIDATTGAKTIPYKMKTLGILPFVLLNLTVGAYIIFAVWSFVAAHCLQLDVYTTWIVRELATGFGLHQSFLSRLTLREFSQESCYTWLLAVSSLCR